MNIFNSYGRYYDLFYADKNYSKEVDFIKGLIKRFQKKESTTLLDIGCGTGKHISLLSDSFKCTGVDTSEQMIQKARSLYGNQAEFLVGSSDKIDFQSDFDIVTALFHVASYWSSNALLHDSFQKIHSALEPSGLFIFDYWYGPGVLTLKPENRHYVKGNKPERVIKLVTSNHISDQNQVDVEYDIYVERSGGLDHFNEHHLMRYFSIPEIEFMAANVGFEILHHAGWLSEEYPTKESWAGITVLSKR